MEFRRVEQLSKISFAGVARGGEGDGLPPGHLPPKTKYLEDVPSMGKMRGRRPGQGEGWRMD